MNTTTATTATETSESGRPGSALATSGANPPAVKTEMTFEQAQNAARQYAMTLYKEAREAKAAAFTELENAVGGPTALLDHTVLSQGEAWMTRLALIGARAEDYSHPQHGAAAALKKSVVEVSKVVAALRAATLLFRADGLFQPVKEHEFVQTCYEQGEKQRNVLAYVANEARPHVKKWLEENVTIAKPEPPKPAAAALSPNGPANARRGTTRIVAQLPLGSDAPLHAKAAATAKPEPKTAPAKKATPAKKGAAKKK